MVFLFFCFSIVNVHTVIVFNCTEKKILYQTKEVKIKRIHKLKNVAFTGMIIDFFSFLLKKFKNLYGDATTTRLYDKFFLDDINLRNDIVSRTILMLPHDDLVEYHTTYSLQAILCYSNYILHFLQNVYFCIKRPVCLKNYVLNCHEIYK